MNEILCIHYFTKIVATLTKLSKTCVIRFSTNNIYYIIVDKGGASRVTSWCELDQGHFFQEYNMEGVNAEQNEIYLEVMPENILRALKSAQSAKSVKIKLTKKHGASLTFEIELPSMASHRLLVHDVSVSIVPRRLWEDFDEPFMPGYDVSIFLPPLKTLKNVIERMKNLGTYLIIAATQTGDLKLQVETDLVTVTTRFRDLAVPTQSDIQRIQQRTSILTHVDTSEARIDIRKLALFLNGQQLNPNRIICNILNGRLVHFCMVQEGLSLQYFIPATAA